MLCRSLRLQLRVLKKMGKTRKNFYAVRVGREVGVYNTWAECQAQVNKYPGAVFKGFSSSSEALSFVNSSQSSRARSMYSRASYGRPSYDTQPAVYSYTQYRGRRYSGESSSSSFQSNNTWRDEPTPSEGYCIKTSGVQHAQRPAVYSDGCCFNNGRAGASAGVGVFWGHNNPHNVSEKLSGTQTNQRAELVSAHRAIQSAIDQGYSAVEVKTDSSYTIKAMTEWVAKWKENGWQTAKAEPVKNKADIVQLDKACQKIDVRWTHVPGHHGIAGNEAADQLAKAGSLK